MFLAENVGCRASPCASRNLGTLTSLSQLVDSVESHVAPQFVVLGLVSVVLKTSLHRGRLSGEQDPRRGGSTSRVAPPLREASGAAMIALGRRALGRRLAFAKRNPLPDHWPTLLTRSARAGSVQGRHLRPSESALARGSLQSGRTAPVKSFGCRQAYESPRRTNPRDCGGELWGFAGSALVARSSVSTAEAVCSGFEEACRVRLMVSRSAVGVLTSG